VKAFGHFDFSSYFLFQISLSIVLVNYIPDFADHFWSSLSEPIALLRIRSALTRFLTKSDLVSDLDLASR
jgi:hypothetical protein